MSLHKQTVFTGAATALITPFDEEGRIDFPALGRMIDRQIAAGISAILVSGTTGEATTLTRAEQREVTAYARDRIGGKIPLLAGCGTNSTPMALELTKGACEGGADALLAVTPYYNKASDRGLILHFSALAEAATRPLMLYNVPSRTGMSISRAAYRALSEHPNIVAVKEASGDLELLEWLVTECGDRLDVYTGNDTQLLPAMKLGAKGVISVYSNLHPKAVAELCRLSAAGEWRRASERSRTLLPRMQALFREVNPIPVKYVASRMGLCRAEYRLPLCPPSPEVQKELDRIFELKMEH